MGVRKTHDNEVTLKRNQLAQSTIQTLALLGGEPVATSRDTRQWPILSKTDFEAVDRVLKRGVLSGRVAPEIRALEKEFAAYVGAQTCLATNSGTAALHIALAAAGVGPGDEVIVPALTFIATAQAVLHQGATPVFADIDRKTYNLDPAKVADRITPRTKVIIPVHLHGLPANMDPINTLAGRWGLTVIEDAAQAHGASYCGRPAGRLGHMAAFSLNSTKNLPAGEGGLFVTDSPELAAKAARFRFNGVNPDAGWDPDHPLDGISDSLAVTRGHMYLPPELTAALARSQLTRLQLTTERSRENAARLTARLSKLAGIETPVVPADCTHVFHKYRVRLDPVGASVNMSIIEFRDLVLHALRAEGVEAVIWQSSPIPFHPLFGSSEHFPEAQAAIDASFIVGSQSFPLFAQPKSVVDGWAEAFEKVWANLHMLVAARLTEERR